ncbi:fumarylacetoacetate hydrolase family protein [Brumimicrobium mesophilum]|uniref:fumarylacetoacetate hydrolase family protein n=1 Tax=Brumimicrobium mesophilum TaxID=392717 RepID=UPI000D13FD03|nr:fumarylacetoacetate hydrolase family protein [Brumimicrobium mesophilum]
MKIICIGRNYSEHAKEMNSPLPEVPMFFMKPETALLPKKNPFYYPNFTKDLHFECELVVKINKLGKNISEKFAHEYYDHVGIGIDFTARDLQKICKDKGHPWEIAKGFEHSAPLGKQWIPLEGKKIQDIDFRLEKNGELVQKGNSKNMIFTVDQIIAYVSQFMTLKIGDLIFTGTPEGVGPVAIGDLLEGYIGDEKLMNLKIK